MYEQVAVMWTECWGLEVPSLQWGNQPRGALCLLSVFLALHSVLGRLVPGQLLFIRCESHPTDVF